MANRRPHGTAAKAASNVIDKRRITANGGLVSYRAALILLGHMIGLKHVEAVYRSLGLARLGSWADIETAIPAETQS